MSQKHIGRAVGLLMIVVLCLFTRTYNLWSPWVQAQTHDRHELWVSDLDLVAKELPKRHKHLFFQLDPDAFYKGIESIKHQIDSKTDEELTMELSKLVAAVGDGHTTVYPKFSTIYPIRLYWFKEGIYAFDAAKDYEAIVDLELQSLNGIALNEVIQVLRSAISHDNEANFKYLVTNYLVIPDVLRGLGLAEDSKIIMDFVDGEGQTVQATICPEIIPDVKYMQSFVHAHQLPLYMQNPGLYYWYTYIPQHEAMYFQYNVCANMPGQPFKAFTQELFNSMETNGAKLLIVDLRNNGGGNSQVMSPFIRTIKKSPLDNPESLFVIIGRQTFSSALLNTLDLKKSTKATFVGEATGGKPNHYGEVRQLYLPNTGITIGYSTKRFINSLEDVPSMLPDVTIEPSFEAFTNGQDPVLDWILQHAQ